jgi:hypothetical protein
MAQDPPMSKAGEQRKYSVEQILMFGVAETQREDRIATLDAAGGTDKSCSRK